jgi:uncharacterized protein
VAESSVPDVQELGKGECLELLRRGGVGRVAVSVSGWYPIVRPVNFFFDDPSQSVVFRSGRGSKLTGLLVSEEAAFEIDGTRADDATAWSVIVTGRAEEVTDRFEVTRLEERGLAVWAPGEHPFWVRIRAEAVSGVRLRTEQPASSDPS